MPWRFVRLKLLYDFRMFDLFWVTGGNCKILSIKFFCTLPSLGLILCIFNMTKTGCSECTMSEDIMSILIQGKGRWV